MKNVSDDLGIMAVCEDCKNSFRVDGNSIISKKCEIEGQTIFLLYYDCPKCGRRHYVQIDNDATKAELATLQKQMGTFMVMKIKRKKIPKKQSVKFKHTQEHLSQTRNELMKQYTGKLIHDSETDSDFTLVFSISV